LFLNYQRNEDEAKYSFRNYRRNEDKIPGLGGNVDLQYLYSLEEGGKTTARTGSDSCPDGGKDTTPGGLHLGCENGMDIKAQDFDGGCCIKPRERPIQSASPGIKA
jgi:hypothetical protein